MPIPRYDSFLLPLLKFAADGEEHSISDAREAIAKVLALTEDERKQLLPSGNARIYDNRMAWAKSSLVHAGLLEATRWSFFRITPKGRELLKKNPATLDEKFLLTTYPEFEKFLRGNKDKQKASLAGKPAKPQTPEEMLEEAYQIIRKEVAEQLLNKAKSCSPAFFERLVIELLLKMGYGGSRQDAGQAIGRTGDGGIDGIIKEDRLGLDVVYVQAKRWDGPVGRPEIQKFVGALHGQRARKGVFITTSHFTKEAEDFVSKIDSRVVLIDGERMARYMMDHGIGVAISASYDIKRIDSDYFAED